MKMLLDELRTIVGPRGWTSDPDDLAPHLREWRGAVQGRTPILVAPGNTDELAGVVRACAASRVGIVPQGGNTGMCAGAVPDDSGSQILLSMGRMNRIRALDPENNSIEVEAGCVLAGIQDAADAAGRYFPLSLGAEGSCQIGGNLSTNAGGLNVIRYGTARNLVLGLEVVLADGTVLDMLRSLRKDTAGYDLKQLFIGSEGTLGIISAATLRLFPAPGETATALVAISRSGDAVTLLAALRESLKDRIEAFELISDRVFELVERHIPGARLPFDHRHPWYVLVEGEVSDASDLENVLTAAMDRGLLLDAVVAKNVSEAAEFWRLRHSISEAERQDGRALKHDISVPLSAMQSFLVRGERLVAEIAPGSRLVVFGHVGDGNLHYNVALPAGLGDREWVESGRRVTSAIYDLVAELGGSFSAEHGIGVLKRDYLTRYRSAPEIELMRQLKRTLDPDNILNPGKVI